MSLPAFGWLCRSRKSQGVAVPVMNRMVMRNAAVPETHCTAIIEAHDPATERDGAGDS